MNHWPRSRFKIILTSSSLSLVYWAYFQRINNCWKTGGPSLFGAYFWSHKFVLLFNVDIMFVLIYFCTGSQLCVLLSAEAIYRSISEILLDEENFKFANVMVETLNTILLTSRGMQSCSSTTFLCYNTFELMMRIYYFTELFELRMQLKELKTRVSRQFNFWNEEGLNFLIFLIVWP